MLQTIIVIWPTIITALKYKNQLQSINYILKLDSIESGSYVNYML